MGLIINRPMVLSYGLSRIRGDETLISYRTLFGFWVLRIEPN